MLLKISKLIGMLPGFALQSHHIARVVRWATRGATDDPRAEPCTLSRLVTELEEARRRASAARTAIAAFEASQQSILAILREVAALEPMSRVRGCGCTAATTKDVRGAVNTGRCQTLTSPIQTTHMPDNTLSN
jgi:hypothetical protein